LLNELGSQHAQRDFISQILAAFPVYQPGSARAGREQLPEPLTDRELEILVLLAQRLSNKEIAAHLHISSATVKRHASNVYQKLQVNDRRHAVAKATAIGLFM
jgi:LuxR family maltose regulon positive regulatory protein